MYGISFFDRQKEDDLPSAENQPIHAEEPVNNTAGQAGDAQTPGAGNAAGAAGIPAYGAGNAAGAAGTPAYGVGAAAGAAGTSAYGAGNAAGAAGTPAYGAGAAAGTPAYGAGTAAGTPAYGAGTAAGTPAYGAGTAAGTPAYGAGTAAGTPAYGAGAAAGAPAHDAESQSADTTAQPVGAGSQPGAAETQTASSTADLLADNDGNGLLDIEDKFREWMRSQVNDDGVRRYTDNTIITYCHALKTTCRLFEHGMEDSIFQCATAAEFMAARDQIQSSYDYEQVNRDNGNGAFGVAMRLYGLFLGELSGEGQQVAFSSAGNVGRPEQRTYYGASDRNDDFHYEEVPMTPMQIIYYGAPGTGKSHRVRKLLESEYPDQKQRDLHCKRLIFHPTYTYDELVGCMKPVMSAEKTSDFMYSPGPLTSLLKEAFLHPAEKYFLVIEEINRGNAPRIFGDLFQLLDRQENGKSQYSVMNDEIATYYAKDPGLKKLFKVGQVWLPANFNIVCTMNTADDNVFVLDAAFKRRFSLEYVIIDFDNMPEEWTLEYPVFAGERPLMDMFMGTALEGYATTLYQAGILKRNWPTFARLINYLIDRLNREAVGRDRPELAKIAENKKLGSFFVSVRELQDPNLFLNKVVFYLKQDVFTYSDHYMLDSYEEIYMKYNKGRGDLFELLV